MLIFISFSIMFAIFGVYAVYVDNYFIAFVSLILFLFSFFSIPFRRNWQKSKKTFEQQKKSQIEIFFVAL